MATTPSTIATDEATVKTDVISEIAKIKADIVALEAKQYPLKDLLIAGAIGFVLGLFVHLI